jgi:xylulokinase
LKETSERGEFTLNQYLLGIDVGTTGTKTLLFRTDGMLIGQAYRSYAMSNPRVGWSEQNAEDWWNAVVATVREVCTDQDISANVKGISLSLQGGTMVAVDKNFQPVRPAMVWNDTRCSAEKEAYLREVGNADSMYQKTGWHLGAGLNAMQIRWMKNNEPDLFAKTAMFLSVPDYISYKMTGIPAVDLSDVGINQLGNIREECYDPEILNFAGITEDKLPRIYRSGEVIGNLTPQAADELGLTTNAVLSAGAHDQYAVALGAGACNAGDILIGSGTCWVITYIGDEPDFHSGLSQSVAAVPGKWGSLWSLSSGGVCLEWLRRNFSSDGDNLLPFEVINREVAVRKAAEDGLYFYPFSGRSALKKGFKKGSFVGLDLAHDRYHLARAVMEGVAFQIVWMMEAFRTKPSSDGLILSGGASKSEFWCQLVADIANLPVRIPAVADLACVGAAILGGVGCGVYEDAAQGCEQLSVGERILYPNPENVRRYAECFEEYKRIAGTLGDAYQL